MLASIQELAQSHPQLVAEVEFLSISNQRETIVVFDRATGQPLHNAVVWQCRRSNAICANLKEAGHEETVRRCTGLRIDAYFSASKMSWLMRERPDLGAKLANGSALVGTIDTYLIYRLTRGKVFATDPTNASRTLLMNLQQCAWDPQLCDLFGVPIAALAELRDCDTRFGTTDAQGLLPRELPICGVMSDSQASLFALRCHEPGMAKITLGTGSSLLINIGSKWKLTDNGTVTTLAWVIDRQPTYALEGLINYSAATIQWLRDQLGLIGEVSESEALATSVQDNGGVYFVPAFAGLGAPYWNPEARAAIVGMSAHSNKAHVVRAALESIAFQVCDILQMMQADSEVELQSISVDGGATRNDFLMQFTSDVTQVRLQKSPIAESSPLGAAFCGALGLGWYTSMAEIAALPADLVQYVPNMDEATAQRHRQGWQQAVQRVLD